jgi:hypothetical protein
MNGWAGLLRRLGSLRRHPDFVQLVAWHEGELDEQGLKWITRHVLACSKCRLQAGRIGRALELYCLPPGAGADTDSLGHGVERLLGVLRDPALLARAQERLRRELDFRLAARLAVCFGSYPISLLDRPAAEGAAFRAEIRRLAETFLGNKAAAAVLDPAGLGWRTHAI